MEFLILIAVLGCIPAAIANSKGRDFATWWLYGAALFIVALIHSLLLKPSRTTVTKPWRSEPASPMVTVNIAVPTSVTGLAQLGSAMKPCPRCAEDVRLAARICRFCNHEFPEPNPEEVKLSTVKAPLHYAPKKLPDGYKCCPKCSVPLQTHVVTCTSCNYDFLSQRLRRPTPTDLDWSS